MTDNANMNDNADLKRQNEQLIALVRELRHDARANLIDWTDDPEGMLPGEPTGFCATIIQKIDKVLPASPK